MTTETIIRTRTTDSGEIAVELRELFTGKVLVGVNVTSAGYFAAVETKGLDEALKSFLRPFVGLVGAAV